MAGACPLFRVTPVNALLLSLRESLRGGHTRRRSGVQGYLAHTKQSPPSDHHRAVSIVWIRRHFLMSEVPLYEQPVVRKTKLRTFIGAI